MQSLIVALRYSDTGIIGDQVSSFTSMSPRQRLMRVPMSKPDPHRAELNELAAELAQLATGPRGGGADARSQTQSDGLREAERIIGELQSKLSEAASDAEEVVTAHPLAAVASAFLLGLLLGRMMGRR